MSFYLRKSISVGPLRFNLSKSGIGVSAGIKGLRFGTGPRGNYIHMGRGGLYYRATIPSSQTRQSLVNSSEHPIPSATHAPLEEIDSADVSKIVDSSSRELLNELNQKQKKIRLWPLAIVGSLLLLFVSVSSAWPSWLLALILCGGIAVIYIAYNRDVWAKTVVLFYDLDAEMEAAYGQLHSAAEKLRGCAIVWHIEAGGRVYDPKYHAGASSLVRRRQTFVRNAAPPYVKTNVETIAIGVGKQTLHFFPDRVLIYDRTGVGAVTYQELSVNVRMNKFIEDGVVPADAKIVDRAWKYVNRSGGPDRRFKDNKELPVCLYDEVSLSSQTGLNEMLQISHSGVAQGFAEAITLLGNKSPNEHSPH